MPYYFSQPCPKVVVNTAAIAITQAGVKSKLSYSGHQKTGDYYVGIHKKYVAQIRRTESDFTCRISYSGVLQNPGTMVKLVFFTNNQILHTNPSLYSQHCGRIASCSTALVSFTNRDKLNCIRFREWVNDYIHIKLWKYALGTGPSISYNCYRCTLYLHMDIQHLVNSMFRYIFLNISPLFVSIRNRKPVQVLPFQGSII